MMSHKLLKVCSEKSCLDDLFVRIDFFVEDQRWLYPKFTEKQSSHGVEHSVMTPNLYEHEIETPSVDMTKHRKAIDRIRGSMIGMAIGDALGAHVEFRPHTYLVNHPVTDLSSGGTWGLEIGQVR